MATLIENANTAAELINDYRKVIDGSITRLKIPDGVTSIRESFLSSNPSFEELIISDDVTSIGRTAFSYCVRLKTVEFGDSIIAVSPNAFYHCTALENIIIKNAVTISNSSFGYCEHKKNVYISDLDKWFQNTIATGSGSGSVFYSEWDLFLNQEKIESLTVPALENATVKVDAMCGCSSITNLNFDSSIEIISLRAFRYCPNLQSIVFGNAISEIDAYAFHGCNSLTDIYYTGTETQWNQITIGYNAIPSGVTIHYNYSEN